jgi:hypothetical protein
LRQQHIPVSSPLVLSIIFALWLMMATAVVWLLSYDTLIQLALHTSGKDHLEQALRESYFTPEKFRWLQYLLPIATLLAIAAVSLGWKKLSRIHVFRYLLADLQRIWRLYKPSGKWEGIVFTGIFVFIIAKALYYIIVSEINYDEAWSYNYYTANPWYLTPFIYSNYPLHELLTHFTKWLPFPMYINLRLPVLITGMIWIVACYLCFSCILNRRAGLIAMALMGTLPPAALYMLHSKGFLMVALFALLQISILYLARQDGWSASKKRWYIITVFMGFWSSPVFFLPFIFNTLSALLLSFGAGGRNQLKSLLIYTAAGIVAGLLVYIPVIAGTGVGPLLNASALNGDPAPHHTMWWHIKLVSEWATGWSWGWMLVAVALAILIGQLAGKYKLIALSGLIAILSIVFIPAITGSFLFPRIWIFVLIPLGWAFLSVINPILNQTKTAIVFVLFFLLSNTYSYTVYGERIWSLAWDHTSTAVSKVLIDKKVSTYYTDFDHIVPIVEYHSRISGHPIRAFISNKQSLRYGNEEILDQADAIVLRRNTTIEVADDLLEIYSDTIGIVFWRPE